MTRATNSIVVVITRIAKKSVTYIFIEHIIKTKEEERDGVSIKRGPNHKRTHPNCGVAVGKQERKTKPVKGDESET